MMDRQLSQPVGNKIGSKHPAALYDSLWSEGDVVDYRIWPLWDEISRYLSTQSRRLEIGCGIAPKIPSEGSYFLDLSPPALHKLRSGGGRVVHGDGAVLPFTNGCFDLVVSSAVLEHIEDDQAALSEMARVLKPEGFLVLTLPVGPQYWTRFDEVVGHYRRYRAEQIEELLAAAQLKRCSFSAYRIFHGQMAANWMAFFITRYPRFSLWVTRKFLLPRRLQIKLDWDIDKFSERLQEATDVHIIAQKETVKAVR